jgi:hypothetical protein
MATLIAQKISQSGLKPVYSSASALGDLLVNTGIQYFHIKNGSNISITSSVVPITETFISPLFGVLVKETAALTLGSGEDGFLGPFEVDAFNSATGTIEIEFTAVTSITIAALYI